MKFGDTFIGQPVYFDGYDDDENEVTIFGYIKGIERIDVENEVIMMRISVNTRYDSIVNINRLKSAKGVF